MRPCVRCGRVQPSEGFEPRRRTCRSCVNEAVRASGRRTYSPERQHRYVYGLSAEAFERLRVAQAGRCAVCGEVPRILVVDHDHGTGEVRGLLCGRCNRALGHLQDDAANCRRAAEYLLRFAQQ